MKNILKMKNQKKSLNLIRVFGLKEAKFWRRTLIMRKKFSWIGFGIALIFITIAHYAFALMHFLFECFLWIVLNSQFKANIIKLQAQVV